jgi:cold shock CspA family protein
VTVTLPHLHRQGGRHFHVRIELTVPDGPPIVVSHEPSLHERLKDIEQEAHHKDAEINSVHRYAGVAVHEAFDAARRRLEDFAREERGAIKVHQVPAHGEIVEVDRADGFGFIQAGEDRIYFHRASVLDNAFEELMPGTRVAFVEEQGEKGRQASTVRILGKHHYVARRGQRLALG